MSLVARAASERALLFKSLTIHNKPYFTQKSSLILSMIVALGIFFRFDKTIDFSLYINTIILNTKTFDKQYISVSELGSSKP